MCIALTYTLHIHQSLNEIEMWQKSLQKEGWSPQHSTLACGVQGADSLPTWHPWSRSGQPGCRYLEWADGYFALAVSSHIPNLHSQMQNNPHLFSHYFPRFIQSIHPRLRPRHVETWKVKPSQAFEFPFCACRHVQWPSMLMGGSLSQDTIFLKLFQKYLDEKDQTLL